MLSSWQISQMHSSQAQGFAGMQSYTNQLSAQLPPMYGGGLAARGMGTGFQPGGGGFSYGAGAMGYGPGNTLGNFATSAIGGVGSAFSGAMPWVGAGAGFAMGGIGGALVGGGIGAVAGMAGSHVFGSMMEGAHEQSALERTLSQFQFHNPASRTGRGFDRNAAQQIGDMVRQMERLPEMLTSFGELNRIMDKMGQMGLMQGARDVEAFQKKFRDTVGTLKDMAKIMGTTMEEALQTFGQARASGFYSQGDQVRNALQVRMTASLTGMSSQQVTGLQQYGAEMSRAYGGTRRTGAMHMTRTAGQLGVMQQMGLLSEDEIMEMTGKEGAAGLQDLSAQFSQLAYKASQSNVGRAMSIAFAEVQDGGFTGRMDDELIKKVRSGEIGLRELKRIARSKAQTRGNKIALSRLLSSGRLQAELAGSTGAEGIAMQLKEILGDRGWENPNALGLVQQRFGFSLEEAEMVQRMLPNLDTIGSQLQTAQKNVARQAAYDSVMKQQYSWDAWKHKLKKKLDHTFTDPFKDMGNEIRDHFQRMGDDFIDELTGRYSLEMTKSVSEAIQLQVAGGRSAGDVYSGLQKRLAARGLTTSRGGSRFDVGGRSGGFTGATARLANWVGLGPGSDAAGARAANILGSVGGGKYLTRTDVVGADADEMAEMGINVLTSSGWTGDGVGISNTNHQRALGDLLNLTTSQGSISKWDEISQMAGDQGSALLKQSYKKAMGQSNLAFMDEDDKFNSVWSGMQKHLRSRGQWGLLSKLKKKGKGEVIAAVQAAVEKGGTQFRDRVDYQKLYDIANLDVLGGKMELSDMTEATVRNLSKEFKGSESSLSWAEMQAMIDEGDPLAKLLTGTDKMASLIAFKDEEITVGKGSRLGGSRGLMTYNKADKNPKGAAQKNAMRMRNLLQKEGKSWSESDKKFIKEMTGMDADQFDQYLKENDDVRKKLLNTFGAGDQIGFYQALKGEEGKILFKERIQDAGKELTKRLGGTAEGDLKNLKVLQGTEGGFGLLQKLQDRGEALSGGDYQSANEIVDEIEKLYGNNPRAREAALALAGSDVQAAYSARKKSRKLKKGISAAEVAHGMGISDPSTEMISAINEQIGGDNSFDEEDKDKLQKWLTNTAASGALLKTGKEAGSTMVSEADIATALKTMSDNATNTAKLLANIAGGRPIGENMGDAGGKS